MGKQKHDTGFIKRNNRPKRNQELISGESLAQKLVNRGLATINVLDRKLKPKAADE